MAILKFVRYSLLDMHVPRNGILSNAHGPAANLFKDGSCRLFNGRSEQPICGNTKGFQEYRVAKSCGVSTAAATTLHGVSDTKRPYLNVDGMPAGYRRLDKPLVVCI